MKAAAACGDPDFTIRYVAVDDDLAADATVDLEDAVVQAPVDVGVGDVERRVQRFADGGERAVGGGDEFGIGQHVGPGGSGRVSLLGFRSMLRDFTAAARIAGRPHVVPAIVVAVTVIALAGCGIKGPLRPAPAATPPA